MLRRVEQLYQARPMVGQRMVARLAAEGGVHAFVLGLGERGGHPLGDIQPGEGGDPVDAALRTVDKTLPAGISKRN